ncbi:MAG: LytTR family transcriptional regulator DNA-binding domain-containing protein [Erysipelotrichaceae bacterium]
MRIVIIDNLDFTSKLIIGLLSSTKEELIFNHYIDLDSFINSNKVDTQVLFLPIIYNNHNIDIILNRISSNMSIVYTHAFLSLITPNNLIYYLPDNNLNSLKSIITNISKTDNIFKEYFLNYNGIKAVLKYKDIIYIEKLEKNLVYHTTSGIFYERASINKKELALVNYNFIRIHVSYLVNFNWVFKINDNILTLTNNEELPISRSKKKLVENHIRSLTKLD